MTGKGQSTRVPKGWEEFYRGMTAITDDFCRRHLNEEYAELARIAIAALCRKRPSPLRSGKPESWACGVLYALGQVNFLSDKASSPSMPLQELCARFGVGASTGASKAKQVRDALTIRRLDHRWMLPSLIEKSGLAWTVMVDGLPADARDLPLPLQEEAARKGLIPYVPAYHAEPEPGRPPREDILERYTAFRLLSSKHQTAAAEEALSVRGLVPSIAVRIGLVDSQDDVGGMDLEDLAAALDLALYTPDAAGRTRIQRYAEGVIAGVSAQERLLLDAMGQARFSIFEITGRHPQAGVMTRDLLSGGEVWLMDFGLERTASRSVRIAARLFRPEDFWMTTGVAVPMNDTAIWEELARKHAIRLTGKTLTVPDPQRLDEIVYAAGLAVPE